jgi:chloramphenicol-sensitive protein RarD
MENDNSGSRAGGGILAAAAFTMWGAFPLYFKLVASVPALEVLAHRAIWVLVTLLPVIVVLGWHKRVLGVFADQASRRAILLATSLLSVNWFLFIWAISNDYVLQSSLGYYINPLLNVLLGVVVLQETMRPVQKLALLIATTGVGAMVVGIGIFPWISISLALTFALYGLVRKKSPVDSLTGLFAETLIVTPVALLFLVWLWFGNSGQYHMVPVVGTEDMGLFLIIMASGVVTALPLLLFTEAARRLPLSVLGFFQYITPTGHFILAVFIFDEPFTLWHLASFALIWVALGLYSSDAIRHRKRQVLERAP